MSDSCNHIIGYEQATIFDSGYFVRESDDNRYKEYCDKFRFCSLCGQQINEDCDFD